MVNKNIYEILNTMDKLHRSSQEFEFLTLDEINRSLSHPTEWDFINSLEHSKYLTTGSKNVNNSLAHAYKLLPNGYEYIDNHKSDMKNNRYIRATFWIALITLIVTVLIPLL